MRVLLALSISVLFALSVAAQSNTIVQERPLRARQGPDYSHSLAFVVPPNSNFAPLGLSPDTKWVFIQFGDEVGWVSADGFSLSAGTSLSIIYDVPDPLAEPVAERCLTIVGDSVPHGDVVVEVPGQNFAMLETKPLSYYLRESLHQRGINNFAVYDRTVSAAYLSPDSPRPFAETREYADTIADNCEFIVMTAWINDLSLEREDIFENYIRELDDLLRDLSQRSPNSQIITQGFYFGVPADFAQFHAGGFIDNNIFQANQALRSACADEGILSNIENTHCMFIETLFPTTSDSHVATQIYQSDLNDMLLEPIPDDIRPLFDVYWRDAPGESVNGDGVHLSETGKATLADATVTFILQIAPDL